MSTNAELKDLTASQIRNKTTPKSITKTNIADRIDAAYDYTDQEAGKASVKVLKTTILEADIKQLFTTPITVLDNTDAEKMKLPISLYIKRNAGTAYVLATSSFALINDSGTAYSGNLNPNPLTNTSDGFFVSAYNIVENASGTERNNLYKLKANVGNPTTGTGSIDVYVTYIEITL